MNALIGNIFDLSRVELKSLMIHHEPVNLKDFMHQIYEIGQGLPWPESVQFEQHLPEILPQIEFDPVRIQQVLMNLISNALKFTRKGFVRLHATVQNHEIHIGIQDTGEGIPFDVQPHVFDRFRQFDEEIARRKHGAGLGLAICRELIEKHDGRIWVISEPGEGSNFVFSLPLK